MELTQGEITRIKILAAIKREEKAGNVLTFREIGDAVGLKSSATVYNHIKILEAQGKIVRGASNTKRGIRAVKSEGETCQCCGGTGWTREGFHAQKIDLNQIKIQVSDVPGSELIGDKRPPEETSFGH